MAAVSARRHETDETPLEAMYRELMKRSAYRLNTWKCSGQRPAGSDTAFPSAACATAASRFVWGRNRSGFYSASTETKRPSPRFDRKTEFDSWRWVDFWYPTSTWSISSAKSMCGLCIIWPIMHGLSLEMRPSGRCRRAGTANLANSAGPSSASAERTNSLIDNHSHCVSNTNHSYS